MVGFWAVVVVLVRCGQARLARPGRQRCIAVKQNRGGTTTTTSTSDGRWLRPTSWSSRQRKKALSLVVLTVQNSALTLTMRYSRTRPHKHKYLASEAVVLCEIFKAVASLFFAVLAGDGRRGSFATRLANAAHDAYAEPGSYVLLVPAALYAVQNNLQYVAASNLEPAIFQLLYQMKLLTTAFFSVVLLGRRLKVRQWASIALLAAGLAEASSANSAPPRRRGPPAHGVFLTGFAAVFAACCTSGFSSVYFERVVKRAATAKSNDKPKISVWARNAQLATLSSIIAATGAILKDGDKIRRRGVLAGFTPLVWTVVALQAGGGLCTAAVIAYADNLLKGFATGISMLLSTIASCYWFDFHITSPFIAGATCVLGAICLYARS
ncbi:hypothetical protein CTAYLR_001187 [Chrysophaeum taylorii]|uniref:UDP-galactose transporter n=1 Tax=Chrysophaeum taylorii TaxID=2483200 RepID=A0AAD7XUR0_9STRA|nr:hypothetical protein CTAYLR_001187 [Chrysophaeum taylorii]